MSYTQPTIPYVSMMRFKGFTVPSGFGAVSAPCPSNAGRNPVDGTCYCNPGTTSDDPEKNPCVPIDVNKPCIFPNLRRNPLDRQCECPPGTIMNPDPLKSDCIHSGWFPNCLDAAGNRVPGCFMGYGMREVAIFAASGLVIGAFLMLVVKR